MLRTNITDWSAEDLWQAYIQLTEAEAAFRIEKSDLRIRPIWHQKDERVLSHIFVCFPLPPREEIRAEDPEKQGRVGVFRSLSGIGARWWGDVTQGNVWRRGARCG